MHHLRQGLAVHTPVRLIENTAICLERGDEVVAVGGIGDLSHGLVLPERTFQGIPPHFTRRGLIAPYTFLLPAGGVRHHAAAFDPPSPCRLEPG